jgi:uncharacterized protein (TIGR02246 family)
VKAIVALGFALWSASFVAAQDPALEGAADAVMKGFVDGFNAGDAAALTSLYAEDGDAGGFSGEIWKGRTAVQEAWAATLNAYKGSTVQITRTGLHILSPDVVVVDGRWEISGGTIAEGEPTTGFVTLIVAKQGDAWLVVSSRAKVPPSN